MSPNLEKVASGGLGRLVVVRTGAYGAWCVIWPEEWVPGRAAGVCTLNFPSDPGGATLVSAGLPGAHVLSCCFSYLLPELGLGSAAMSACIARPFYFHTFSGCALPHFAPSAHSLSRAASCVHTVASQHLCTRQWCTGTSVMC